MTLWRSKKDRGLGWSAVDAGSSGLCGVSVRAPDSEGGKPQVLKCGFAPEAEPTPDALAQLGRKIGTAGFAWTSPLNRGDYKIIVVPEPAVKQAEMAESVRWSLGTVLDFPVDEASVDWMSIPTLKHQPQRQQHLYAIVARRDVIDRRAALFRQAKIDLQAIDIRETAQRNIAALLEKPGEGLGMVAMTGEGVQITFTFEGELYLDRFIEASLAAMIAGDDESRNKMLERVTLQVQRSIDFVHRTLPFLRIGRIVIAPLPAPIALSAHLAQNIAEKVEMLDLASVFDFGSTPELAAEENQARFFIALGSALRGMRAAT
jgi:MSHA biogenesis protein MshI